MNNARTVWCLANVFFTAVAALSAVLIPTVSTGHAASVREIRVVEAGGKSGEALEEAYIKPFTAKTGIKVARESPTSLGKLRAMVQSGTITAVLVEIAGAGVEQAKALNLLEPLDWGTINPEPIFPESKGPMALGYQYFSTIMSWRRDVKAPSDWQDFWNVKDFPGKRTLPDIPYYSLPIALLADGVSPRDLYPLDLDRAFRSLAKIKGHVSVWWKAGAQPPQLLKDNEVQYAIAWSGRVVDEEGISYSFNQGLLNISYFVVPKGVDSDQKATAMKLLHEMTIPKNQAVAAHVIPYTGSSPHLDALLPKDRLHKFPTSKQNKDKQVLYDLKWWFEHTDEVERRWQEFKLGM